MKIYIAAPYTKGDVAQNVRRAIEAAEAVVRKGHTPYIPHLSHFWHLVYAHPVEFWYDYDLEWLAICEAVLRLDGESAGADREVDTAERLGLTVYRALEEIPDVAD